MEVDVINRAICYSKFYEEYLVNNRLCMFSKSFTDTWSCRKLWSENGIPNWNYLQENYGEAEVPVANCDQSYFDSHSKSNWTLKDYLAYLKEYHSKNYPSNMPCFYLKDWHFMKNFPASIAVYETPTYFAVDWLNEYWMQGTEDDYRFVYIGPKGSWTPLHADVYGSFSWSANVVGKKRWIFFPPGEELKLKSLLGISSLPNDLGQIDLSTLQIKYFDLIQNAGEIIFVPSGWYHQVWNLEDTISINHNWFNGANVNHIYKALVKASSEVEAEVSGYGIENLEREQLETVLNSHHGMNFQQFRHLLQTVIERRDSGFLRIHSSQVCHSCSGDSLCNEENHLRLDRQTALKLLENLSK